MLTLDDFISEDKKTWKRYSVEVYKDAAMEDHVVTQEFAFSGDAHEFGDKHRDQFDRHFKVIDNISGKILVSEDDSNPSEDNIRDFVELS